MKRKIDMNKMRKLFPATIVACVLSSCTLLDREVWDIAPVTVRMEVTDAQGRNLFDETTPGNWLGSEISADFEGESYIFPTTDTRTYKAVLRGLFLEPYENADRPSIPVLAFGELDGTKERDSDLVVRWPDGSEDIITVHRKFRWKWNGDPDGATTWKLNGKETGSPVRIVK